MTLLANIRQGNIETYEQLKQIIKQPPKSGSDRSEVNLLRQYALNVLATMNLNQNNALPTDSLPGIDIVRELLRNKNEDPNVKTSALAFLQALNRPQDPIITEILSLAAKDKNPTVKEAYMNAVSGGTPGITA